MKTTGIVRRMDELGRVVIPKEMRRTMHLREGEELEIFADGDGLFLKKYSAISALGPIVHEYARVVSQMLSADVFVVDTDGVLSSGGAPLDEHTLSTKVSEIISSRKRRVLENAAALRAGDVYPYLAVYPVLAHGDLFGALVVGAKRAFDARAEAVMQTACCLLQKHIGD